MKTIPTKNQIVSKRAEILKLAESHGLRNVRLFGSVAREEAGSDSDVDLLVALDSGHTLFDVGGFLMDVQDLLGRRVDVVTERGIHPSLKHRVLNEAVPL